MKRQCVLKVTLAISLSAMAGYLYFSDNNEYEFKGLILDNIEALATGEGNGAYDCLGSGSVSCHGDYVKYMLEGYSLDLE